MPTSIVKHAARYLYASPPSSPQGAAAIEAVMSYREIEGTVEHLASESLGLRGLDLLAVRYLLQARRENREFTQTELGVMLGLSSAGITKLVLRLAEDGWVARAPHPTDRRAQIVTATSEAEERMTAAYNPIHQVFVDAFDELDSRDVAGFTAVLGHLTRIVGDRRPVR